LLAREYLRTSLYGASQPLCAIALYLIGFVAYFSTLTAATHEPFLPCRHGMAPVCGGAFLLTVAAATMRIAPACRVLTDDVEAVDVQRARLEPVPAAVGLVTTDNRIGVQAHMGRS
jgi:hypothetical protein